MNRLFKRLREDTCHNCHREKAIELYDQNDNPFRFSYLLDTHRYDVFSRRMAYYARCRYCGKEYKLDWSNRQSRIPTILDDIDFQIYMQQYNKSKIESDILL